jgi:hypothetical protein
MASSRPDPLAHIPAWISGAAGGATAGLGQFVGTTMPDTLSHCFAQEFRAALIQLVSVIGTAMMAVVGAIVAFFLQSKTQNRWALFWVGMAATSLGTTALPGVVRLIRPS